MTRRAFWLLSLLLGGAFVFAADVPGIWLDVPFVKQEADGCGSASIAMVMQYWSQRQGRLADKSADAAEIQRALFSHQARGIYASAMERYFREHGVRAFVFRGDWNLLKTHLQKGRPLIVALQPGAKGAPLHYLVVVGLNWQEGVVLVNDPAQRKLLKQDRPTFEREWSATHQWTLLAVPQADSQ